MELKIFQNNADRLKLGVQGIYPDKLIEQLKERSEVRHAVHETLTRPWIRHFFLTQFLRETSSPDDIIARDRNIIDVFKTTIPLPDNSFIESTMSSWQMFLGSAFRDADTPWYGGIRKIMVQERFYSAIEQLELEIPTSNPQHAFQFHDHTQHLRKMPRVPIKLLFSLPGNEREIVLGMLRQAMNSNPHSVDVALLTYCFFKAWGRTRDILDIARLENRTDIEEWYFWTENDMSSLGALKREAGDYTTSFFIYDRALLSAAENKETADWFLKESEFKSAFHFYYKAKEFETALDLLQNISTKEFAELTNLRRASKGERPIDTTNEASRINALYQEEMETLRGFARIRAAETYKQISVKARQHFDRETIETKYAFGELTEDEYQRLIRQIAERAQ